MVNSRWTEIHEIHTPPLVSGHWYTVTPTLPQLCDGRILSRSIGHTLTLHFKPNSRAFWHNLATVWSRQTLPGQNITVWPGCVDVPTVKLGGMQSELDIAYKIYKVISDHRSVQQ